MSDPAAGIGVTEVEVEEVEVEMIEHHASFTATEGAADMFNPMRQAQAEVQAQPQVDAHQADDRDLHV